MKNKIVYIILAFLIVGIFLGIRLFSGEDNWVCEKGRWIKHGNPNSPPPSTECLDNTPPIINPTDKYIETDKIKIILPTGWEQVNQTIEGIDIMLVNTEEKITDLNANKINFQTYFAFVQVTSTKSLTEYYEYFKEELDKTVSNYKIGNISEGMVDGNPAKFLELEFNQQDIDFKTFVALIKIKDDTIWSLTLNTTKSMWERYTSFIPQLLDTIKFK